MKYKTKKGTLPIAFYIPEEILAELEKEQKKYPYFNRSSFLVKILMDFLEQQKEKEKEKQGVNDGASN